MKINWKARFKNKTFVIAFATLVISSGYQIITLFDIVPAISESSLVNWITMLVNFVAMLGVVADPTTEGISDSDRAMTYYTDSDVRVEETATATDESTVG